MDIEKQCLLLASQVNDAIKTSYSSNNSSEKRDCYFLAVRKLDELKESILELPGGYITGLDKFENNLEEIQREYFDEGVFTKNLIAGWIYSAELKLETPLSALQNHGEFRAVDQEINAITQDQKHGGWMTKTTTFREMGIDLDEMRESYMSSIVGPVPLNGGEFLDYLIELRVIIESSADKALKLEMLKECLSKQHHYHFNKKLGGVEMVIHKLFKSLKT